MNLRVDLLSLDADGEQHVVGSVVWDGEAVSYIGDEEYRWAAEDPVSALAGEGDADGLLHPSDGELFMGALRYNYDGTHFRATKPMDASAPDTRHVAVVQGATAG